MMLFLFKKSVRLSLSSIFLTDRLDYRMIKKNQYFSTEEVHYDR